MIRIFNTDKVAYTLPANFNPASLFNYEKDYQLDRNHGELGTRLVGDGAYKPNFISFEGTFAFASIAERDTMLSELTTAANTIRALVYEDTVIYTNFAYVEVQKVPTDLQIKVNLYIAPEVVSFDVVNSGVIYWGSDTVTFSDSYTFG